MNAIEFLSSQPVSAPQNAASHFTLNRFFFVCMQSWSGEARGVSPRKRPLAEFWDSKAGRARAVRTWNSRLGSLCAVGGILARSRNAAPGIGNFDMVWELHFRESAGRHRAASLPPAGGKFTLRDLSRQVSETGPPAAIQVKKRRQRDLPGRAADFDFLLAAWPEQAGQNASSAGIPPREGKADRRREAFGPKFPVWNGRLWKRAPCEIASGPAAASRVGLGSRGNLAAKISGSAARAPKIFARFQKCGQG